MSKSASIFLSFSAASYFFRSSSSSLSFSSSTSFSYFFALRFPFLGGGFLTAAFVFWTS